MVALLQSNRQTFTSDSIEICLRNEFQKQIDTLLLNYKWIQSDFSPDQIKFHSFRPHCTQGISDRVFAFIQMFVDFFLFFHLFANQPQTRFLPLFLLVAYLYLCLTSTRARIQTILSSILCYVNGSNPHCEMDDSFFFLHSVCGAFEDIEHWV